MAVAGEGRIPSPNINQYVVLRRPAKAKKVSKAAAKVVAETPDESPEPAKSALKAAKGREVAPAVKADEPEVKESKWESSATPTPLSKTSSIG